MRSYEIQMHLKKQGISQKALAEKISVSPMAVSDVIRRKKISDRIHKAIADAIGIDPKKVFPDYYIGYRRIRRNK